MGTGYVDNTINRDSALDTKDNMDQVTEPYDSSSNNRYGNVNYGSDNDDKNEGDR